MRYTAVFVSLLVASCGAFEPDRSEHEARCANIPVVDQGQQQGQPAGQPAPSQAATPSAAAKATVREYIRKLMDVTRVVPDTAAKKGGPRGSPGTFQKLSVAQVDEIASAVIYGAARYMPKSLTDEQRWALVCAEISIESAFTPSTSGDNPGNVASGPHYISVGMLQLTLNSDPNGKGMWDDIFRQYADGTGLVHYDGSPWDPKTTTTDALSHNIYDGIVAALWCITEQGRRGCPDWFGGADGPMPKTMHTAFLAWVIGGPALKSGGDLAGQRDAYIASIQTDLALLGYPVSLIDTAF